jgi:hypothetical protein
MQGDVPFHAHQNLKCFLKILPERDNAGLVTCHDENLFVSHITYLE